jgi:hypothetical protein
MNNSWIFHYNLIQAHALYRQSLALEILRKTIMIPRLKTIWNYGITLSATHS